LLALLAGLFRNSAGKGLRAEAAASRYLRKEAGLKTLLRNYRHGKGEIDLVCRSREGLLVFVEVRARQSEALVGGLNSISPNKKRLLKQTCQAYLRALRPPRPLWRFDVVAVELEGERIRDFRHHKNISL
jgi:putative endonuclease